MASSLKAFILLLVFISSLAVYMLAAHKHLMLRVTWVTITTPDGGLTFPKEAPLVPPKVPATEPSTAPATQHKCLQTRIVDAAKTVGEHVSSEWELWFGSKPAKQPESRPAEQDLPPQGSQLVRM